MVLLPSPASRSRQNDFLFSDLFVALRRMKMEIVFLIIMRRQILRIPNLNVYCNLKM